MTDVASLAYGRAERNLDRQERNLDTLRTKATGLLGVASIAAGVLAPKALEGRHLHLFVIVGAVAFVAVAVLCVLTLKPASFSFALNVDDLVESGVVMTKHYSDEVGDWTAGKQLADAGAMDKMHERNAALISARTTMFSWACGLIGVEVAAFLLDLIIHHA